MARAKRHDIHGQMRHITRLIVLKIDSFFLDNNINIDTI